MIKKYKLVVLIAVVAILFSLPIQVYSLDLGQNNQKFNNIKFDQPIFAPGSIWFFNITFDMHPENSGKIAIAYFSNSTDIINDTIYNTFTITTPSYNESQLLGTDIFERRLKTKTISRGDMAMNLTFHPELIHFDYPLYSYKSWGDTINYTGWIYGSPVEGIVSYSQEVIREESINTPAGTFETAVVDNTMVFPALGQNMNVRLWISEDGLLVKREAYVNNVKVQEIELEAYDTTVSSMLNQTILETYLLNKELITSPSERNLDVKTGSALENLRDTQRLLEYGNKRMSIVHLDKASTDLDVFIKEIEKEKNLDPNTVQRLITGATVIRSHINLIKENI